MIINEVLIKKSVLSIRESGDRHSRFIQRNQHCQYDDKQMRDDGAWRWNLGSIAKILQLIASKKGFGLKEPPHLHPLNDFIMECHNKMKFFYAVFWDQDSHFNMNPFHDACVDKAFHPHPIAASHQRASTAVGIRRGRRPNHQRPAARHLGGSGRSRDFGGFVGSSDDRICRRLRGSEKDGDLVDSLFQEILQQ